MIASYMAGESSATGRRLSRVETSSRLRFPALAVYPSPAVIYLDNNATTRPDARVLERIARVSANAWGNPGSAHQLGRRARQELETAREQIADALDADPDDVVFTSGATESCNLAIRGLARRPGPIAQLAGDHPASWEAVDELATRGWSRATIPLRPDGSLGGVDALPWDALTLLTLPLAHNETGVVFDVDDLAVRCRRHRVAWHLDATQAVGRVPVSVRSLGMSALSLSGHKLHGPRGVGAVVCGRGVTLRPQQLGGHQEAGRRAGTEAVALAAGLAEAVTLVTSELVERTARMKRLRDRFESAITSQTDARVIAGDSPRLPNTSCLLFPAQEGEPLLVALDLAGVCCSLGSACASGSPEPAPVLLAMGLEAETARRCLRFSLSHETTEDEIDAAVAAIARLVR